MLVRFVLKLDGMLQEVSEVTIKSKGEGEKETERMIEKEFDKWLNSNTDLSHDEIEIEAYWEYVE